jgi:hypothetical protein
MIQRNIYSGGIIEVEKKRDEGFFLEEFHNDFGPVAIKTGDFRALFTFQEALNFSFPARGSEDFILVTGVDTNKRSVTGIIACCLYDEIIELREVQLSKPKSKRRN